MFRLFRLLRVFRAVGAFRAQRFEGLCGRLGVCKFEGLQPSALNPKP